MHRKNQVVANGGTIVHRNQLNPLGLDSFTVAFVVFLPVGKNQSEEDNLSSMLQSYKEDHPSFYPHISETAKIIQSLRDRLARGQLATKGALTKADSLFTISTLHRQPIGAIVADFLVDVDVPELLTEVLRSLYKKYPNLFSSVEQVGQSYSLSKVLKA